MRVKVNVTKDVLERSKMCGMSDFHKNIPTNCAVSIAIIDLFPNAWVETRYCYLLGESRSSYNNCGAYDAVQLPEFVSRFIEEFDESSQEQRISMSPFSFEIEVPEYVISKIGIGQVYKVLSESRTLELVMLKETTI